MIREFSSTKKLLMALEIYLKYLRRPHDILFHLTSGLNTMKCVKIFKRERGNANEKRQAKKTVNSSFHVSRKPSNCQIKLLRIIKYKVFFRLSPLLSSFAYFYLLDFIHSQYGPITMLENEPVFPFFFFLLSHRAFYFNQSRTF